LLAKYLQPFWLTAQIHVTEPGLDSIPFQTADAGEKERTLPRFLDVATGHTSHLTQFERLNHWLAAIEAHTACRWMTAP
jgi:hypothetical protein